MPLMPVRRFSFSASLILILLLWIASVVYWHDVAHVSFWEDESWMAIAARGDLLDVWQFAAERGVHPPLYFYLGWAVTRLAGESEWVLRGLAGMCALLGIAWSYRLGADIGGHRAGVYVVLLLIGSLFLIYFARLARQYTLLFALAPALVVVYRHWSGQPRRSLWLALALVTAALLYTHYFGIWLALVLALHGLVTLPRQRWLHLLGALLLAGILFLPWMPAVFSQLTGSGSGLGYVNPDIILNLRAYLDRVFNGSYALGFLLLGLGLVALWRLPDRRGGFWLLLLWLTVPLALSVLINTRFAWFIERNMIFTLSGVVAVMGCGLAWLSRAGRWGSAAALLLALGFGALGFINYTTYWPFITPDWRSLSGAMKPDARPTDPILLDGEPYSLAYYLSRDLQTEAITLDSPISDVRGMSDEERQQAVQGALAADRLWLVTADGEIKSGLRTVLTDDWLMTRQIVLGVLVAELYQHAPDAIVTTFGDQIALGYRLPAALNQDATGVLTLDLWWRALRTPDEDYSVGVYLVNAAGVIVAQVDGGFDQGRVPALLLPTDRWSPDARTLSLAGLPQGVYDLTVAVYDWRSGERLSPTNGLLDRSWLIEKVDLHAQP